jgi:hypothetical protein
MTNKSTGLPSVSPQEAEAMVIHQAKKNLIDFAIAVDPNYQDTWFHEQLANILQAAMEKVERGEDVRIVITIPPRHGKSEISTKKFSAWVLGHHPDWPIIVASYSGELATKFGEETRDIMQSSQYQSIFGARLRPDAKAKGYWKTNEGGSYTAVGAGGAITGKGLKIGIIDDIFKNREEAESQTIRDSRWDWYRSTFYTRQEGATAIVILNTRWHTDDLVGRLLAEQKNNEQEGAKHYDKWTLINFPAIATEDEEYRKKGEALWPGKFSIEKLRTIENTLGPYEFAALYQGSPITSENQEFKQEWIKRCSWSVVEALNTRKFATIDPGGKELENDDTGIVRNYVSEQNIWYIKAIGVHLDSTEIINLIFRLHDEGFEKIGIEETVFLKAIKPFYDLECRKRNKFPNIISLKHGGRQKEVRIRGLIPRYSGGAVFHIDGECGELENQMWVFPMGAKDDILDAACYQNDIAEAPVSIFERALLNEHRQQRREEVRGRYGL